MSDKDNEVHATLRFDTLKRRLTVAEATELRDKVVQLVQGQPILIDFESVGKMLTGEGRTREALRSYRDLIALQPKEAVPHLRLATTLLAAGLAEAARAEAQIAVRLEPTSAISEKTLAQILECDLVGRKLRPGSDYAGAEAALRAAEKLDPEDKTAIADLAILLEYNHWGLHYGPGARLKDAVDEYHKLTTVQQTDLGIENNLAFALFYAGEFSEAQESAHTLNPKPIALIVACEAALNGSQAGLVEARKQIPGEERFKEVTKAVAAMLENIRKYSLAADFKEAGASEVDASNMQAEASLLRKAKLHEQLHLADDPVGIALRFFLLENDPNLTLEELSSISSRNGAITLAVPEMRDRLVREEREALVQKAREGVFADIGIDLSISQAEPKIQGNDKSGYKVTLWASADYKQAIYIVKEENHYKVLATSRFPAGANFEVLDRIAANDLASARVLLDLLQENTQFQSNGDPLGGRIPFWLKGKYADALKMNLAAAETLMFKETTAARGISTFQSAENSATTDSEKGDVAFALAYGYDSLHQYEKELILTSALTKQYPESWSALNLQAHTLLALGRIGESDQLVHEWMGRNPDDIRAMERLILNATAREDFGQARDLSQKMVGKAKDSALNLNRIAWYSFFMGKPGGSDVDAVLKATQLTNNSWYYLHTLGCIYAELGKLKEARDVLVQAMDSANFIEPDENFWYAFGRIAEQAGERDSALADYARVTPPKDPFDLPDSTYRLAQIRLKVMQ